MPAGRSPRWRPLPMTDRRSPCQVGRQVIGLCPNTNSLERKMSGSKTRSPWVSRWHFVCARPTVSRTGAKPVSSRINLASLLSPMRAPSRGYMAIERSSSRAMSVCAGLVTRDPAVADLLAVAAVPPGGQLYDLENGIDVSVSSLPTPSLQVFHKIVDIHLLRHLLRSGDIHHNASHDHTKKRDHNENK
jgi:hypothetical protein